MDAVLDCIAACCESVYFHIHLKEDCGKFIDEPLHLTIKPTSWWHKKILQRYPETEAVEKANGRAATFYAKRVNAKGSVRTDRNDINKRCSLVRGHKVIFMPIPKAASVSVRIALHPIMS